MGLLSHLRASLANEYIIAILGTCYLCIKKGGISVLSAKELMQLEDFLTIEQSCTATLNSFSNQVQDSQAKQLLQQMAQKNQQHFQTISKHLNSGQKLQ
jgi:hypothetical protein